MAEVTNLSVRLQMTAGFAMLPVLFVRVIFMPPGTTADVNARSSSFQIAFRTVSSVPISRADNHAAKQTA